MTHQNKKLILVVDDEEDILALIQFNLEKAGFNTFSTSSGEDALTMINGKLPDLIILDLMLPGMDGLTVCRHLRDNELTKNIPIIMVTARGEEADIVTGLTIGADDYITKPFSPGILVARARALLRRLNEPLLEKDVKLALHNIVLHPGRHEVLVDGDEINLTATEFSVLQFLMRRPGWVATRSQIVDSIRGDNYPVTERSIDVQVVSLRRKLGLKGDCIETVRGIGYRFKD